MHPANNKLSFNKTPSFPVLKPKQKQIFLTKTNLRWRFFIVFLVILGMVLSAVGYFFFDNLQKRLQVRELLQGLTYQNQVQVQNQNYSSKLVSNFGFIREDNIVHYKQNMGYHKEVLLPFVELKEVNNFLELKEIDNYTTQTVLQYNQQYLPGLNQTLLIGTSNYNSYDSKIIDQITQWEQFLSKETNVKIVEDIKSIILTKKYKGLALEIDDRLVNSQKDKYLDLIALLKTEFKKNQISFTLVFNQKPDLQVVSLLDQDTRVIFGTNQDLSYDQYIQNSLFLKSIQEINKEKNKDVNLNKDFVLLAPSTFIDQISSDNLDKADSQKILNYSSLEELLKRYNPEIKLSSNKLSFEFSYIDQLKLEHKIMYNDAVSLFNNLDRKSNSNFQLGLNNLVTADPGVFKLHKNLGNLDSQLNILENEFNFTFVPQMQGSGEIINLTNDYKYGKREFVISNQKIVSQKVISYPIKSLIQKSGLIDKNVVLTFDDGPDPEYTPRILDILKENNVKATFFVIGDKVAKHPDIIKRMYTEGHEIENHTFNHISVRNMDNVSFEREIRATQLIIEQTIGKKPNFFRTPYNNLDGEYTAFDKEKLQVVNKQNLQISEADIDTRDWEVNNKEQIVEILVNKIKDGKSGQIMMHDSGGNRNSTVEAIGDIIKYVKNNDYQFISMSSLVADNKTSLDNYTSSEQVNKFDKEKINNSQNWINLFLDIFFWYLRICLVAVLVRFIFMICIYFIELYKRKKWPQKYVLNQMPSVDIIVPCFNEEKVVCQTIASILACTYVNFTVIVIDDCSTDESFSSVHKVFKDHPQVKLMHKRNGGKAQALNYAIKNSKADYVICCDADTLFVPDTITNLMKHFSDNRVAGVAGFVQIGNNNNLLVNFQKQEYIYGQNFDKVGYSGLNSVIVVPGAIGAWRKSVLLEVGLLDTDTLAEDADLTIKVLRKGYKIIYDHEAISVTEAPETLKALYKQRVRWQYGNLQLIYKNRDMIFNPKYKFVGLLLMPEVLANFLFLGVLPISDILLFITIGKLFISTFFPSSTLNEAIDYNDLLGALTFSAGYFCLYLFTYLWATYLDKSKNKWRLTWLLPLNIFLYRHFIWYVNVVVIIKAFKGLEVGWNKLPRTGNAIKNSVKI